MEIPPRVGEIKKTRVKGGSFLFGNIHDEDGRKGTGVCLGKTSGFSNSSGGREEGAGGCLGKTSVFSNSSGGREEGTGRGGRVRMFR